MTYPKESLPADADRVVISVNPKAGARSANQRVDGLVAMLQTRGIVAEVGTSLHEAAVAAIRWHEQGRLRALVGIGGDGTAAELLNRTPAGLPMAMLPSGNENLLARYVGWSQSPEILGQMLLDGRIASLDAGRANGRLFLLMVGCGFDADVVRRVHSQRTGHIRSRDYFKPIFHSVRTYAYPAMQITYDADSELTFGSATIGETARWLFVFNLPCYGGDFRIAPHADGADGMLDACLFRRGGMWHGLRYASGIRLGIHRQMRDVVMRRVRRITITAEAEVPFQLDGDLGGVLPLEIEAVPKRMTLIVP